MLMLKTLIICCSDGNAYVELNYPSLQLFCYKSCACLHWTSCVLNEIIYVSKLDTNQKAKTWSHQTHIVYLRSPYSISSGSRTQSPQIICLYWVLRSSTFHLLKHCHESVLKQWEFDTHKFGRKCVQKPDSTSYINELSFEKSITSKISKIKAALYNNPLSYSLLISPKIIHHLSLQKGFTNLKSHLITPLRKHPLKEFHEFPFK